jgi:predicted metal-dependent peptidase
MDAKEKLTRARIQIQNRNPFFAYLSLYLKFKESKSEDMKGNGIGVDKKGNVYYDPEWIEKLSDEELIGVLIHEIMHLSFLHLIRMCSRDMQRWNIATDIVINQLIIDNNFILPSEGIIPEHNEVNIFGLKITNIRNKTAENVYDELVNIPEQKQKGFDYHITDNGEETEDDKKLEQEWLGRLEEAYVSAKMRGNVPGSIEKLIGNLHK